ncbi:MAG: adenylate kinase [Candidatus Krumholzibacteriota bacterium]|nr:adenylate kinase [Candidatus Krumholzibacteriota bacterium]
MHIVIIGPPGSGKGTQASRVADALGLRHLSTGDLLREAVANKTPLGVEAERYMRDGLLVPDDLMLGLIAVELETLGDTGWILDGFPRTLPQAEALSAMLAERKIAVDRALLVDVDPEVIVGRLTSRRVCPACKAVFNLATMPDAGEICARCGGNLVKRPDDEEETVRRRLDVYEAQTAPVVDYFRRAGGLVTVDGAGDMDDITAEILRLLK